MHRYIHMRNMYIYTQHMYKSTCINLSIDARDTYTWSADSMRLARPHDARQLISPRGKMRPLFWASEKEFKLSSHTMDI